MTDIFDHNPDQNASSFTTDQVEKMFAEEQGQVSIDDCVDFSTQLDCMNQEDAYNYYRDQGNSDDAARSITAAINHGEQVRQDVFEPSTAMAQFPTPEAIAAGRVGDHFTLLTPDTTPSNLGIQNDNPDTQTREQRTYQTVGEVVGLVSTAADCPDWNGSGEVYDGGGLQIHFSDAEKEKIAPLTDSTLIYYETAAIDSVVGVDTLEEHPAGEINGSVDGSPDEDFDDDFDDGFI